jgi:hypothetical protein
MKPASNQNPTKKSGAKVIPPHMQIRCCRSVIMAAPSVQSQANTWLASNRSAARWPVIVADSRF